MSKSTSDIEFADLLRIHHARMFGFVRSLVLDATDAQDVFQETVLALWQHQHDFDPTREFDRWALGVARNKVFDYFKAKKRDQTRFSDEMLAVLAERQAQANEDADYQAAREQALQSCMERLDASQRELLLRCYQQQESVAEVAATLQRTPGSVYSSLNHVRVKLLECVRLRLRQGADNV